MVNLQRDNVPQRCEPQVLEQDGHPEIREDLRQRLSFEREAAELLICYCGLAARGAELTR